MIIPCQLSHYRASAAGASQGKIGTFLWWGEGTSGEKSQCIGITSSVNDSLPLQQHSKSPSPSLTSPWRCSVKEDAPFVSTPHHPMQNLSCPLFLSPFITFMYFIPPPTPPPSPLYPSLSSKPSHLREHQLAYRFREGGCLNMRGPSSRMVMATELLLFSQRPLHGACSKCSLIKWMSGRYSDGRGFDGWRLEEATV